MSEDVATPPSETAELVPEVVSIGLNEIRSEPPQIVVHATGWVPTTGWSHATLSRAIYDVQPEDGIQDFDFLAERPEGSAGNVEHEISAKSEMFEKEDWMKGVRVRAAKNSEEKPL